ncbi:MAG: YfhO family protein [Bacteroidetes bacterium]|nr:YfhO family protein [Bacteroidota bacterium]
MKPKNKHWIFIPLIVFVYWQIAFCTAALKWDLLDVVFPFRYHFSSSILSGNFPLWNPYIQTGVSFYADLQAPTYYPELLAVSSLGGYSIYWMHFLLIAYLVVAFFGVFRLIRFFQYSNWVASMCAFVYVCSGYFVGHGQHFFLLVGSAWLPWVIWAYLVFTKERNQRTAIVFILTTFLMLTGSYQALSICLFYLLLIFFVVKVYRFAKQARKELLSFLFWHAGIGLVLLVMLSPMLLAILEVSPQVDRLSNGVTWEKAASYGQSFKSLLSFFAPLSVAKTNEFFGSIDSSMLNHFVGVSSLFFAFFGWNSKRSVFEWILLIFGLIIGSMSFSDLPIRKIMFEYVPMMNLFLQAPYVRVFLILGIVVFIAGGLKKWREESYTWKQAWFPFLSLITIFTFLAFRWGNFDFSDFFRDWLNPTDFLTGWSKFEFTRLLAFQWILNCLFLLTLLLFVLFSKKIKRTQLWVSCLLFFELFLASQWNQSETYVDRNYKPAYLQKSIDLTPKGFPIPHLTPIGYNDEQHAFISPFWRNTSIFQKEISFNAFSSFEMNNFSYLDDKNANLKSWVLRQPLVYFSGQVLPFTSFEKALKDDKTCVFAESAEFNKLKKIKLNSHSKDQLKIAAFSPNEIRIKTRTRNEQLLVLQQSFQPEWNALINGKKVDIFRVNKNYQAVILPAGVHSIEFKFEKNSIVILYFISQLIFWLLLVYLIYLNFSNEQKSKRIYTLIFILPIVFIAYWTITTYNGNLNSLNTKQQLLTDWKERPICKRFGITKTIKITNKDQYINLGKWNFNELKSPAALRFQADCKMDSIQPTLLVYEVIRDGVSVKWEAMKFERQMAVKDEFNHLLFMRNLSDLKKNDGVILYVWNTSKTFIQLKNVKIEFLK